MELDRQRPDFAVHLADRAGSGVEITVFGDLDLASAPRLRRDLDRAIARDNGVTIDLRACSFIDSTGVAELVGAAWRLKEQGQVLRIRGAKDPVRRTFDLAGLSYHEAVVLDAEPEPE
jgi:anti-sigma B factor antagonist